MVPAIVGRALDRHLIWQTLNLVTLLLRLKVDGRKGGMPVRRIWGGMQRWGRASQIPSDLVCHWM